jgi:spore germination protein KC
MKRVTAFVLAILLALLGGCWDAREIDELGLVMAVGIDKAPDSDGFLVTVQLANQRGLSQQGSGSTSPADQIYVASAQGKTLFEAVRALSKAASKRIMWAHNYIIIIGESVARDSITPVIDFFTHNPELRMKAAVVIAKGKASDYLVSKIGMENPPGLAFVLLEEYRKITAESVQSRMLEISSALKSEYGNPMISEVSIKRDAMLSEGEKQTNDKYTETIALQGTAVFRKDKMIGSLTPEESRGIAWILNQTKNTVVTVFDPEHDNKGVAVETTGVRAKLYSKVVNGMPGILIRITGAGDIVEEDGTSNGTINEMKDNIARLLNKRIEQEVKSSLEVIQKRFGVDCLGFAAVVHSQNGKEWNVGLGKAWQETFPQMPVTVSVDMDIRTSTLNQEPMKVY